MKESISAVFLLRTMYSVFLLCIVWILCKEVFSVWFDRQLTFGEVKYFKEESADPQLADRFRHLLNQDYNFALGLINDYRMIMTGAKRSEGRHESEINLLSLDPNQGIAPQLLSSLKGFETFQARRDGFAQIDLSFQGLDIKKIVSSLRTYLSPSFDVALNIARTSPSDLRATVRWPMEGRPLAGSLERYRDFQIGPSSSDYDLSKKVSCYLLWLQLPLDKDGNPIIFEEFCLWLQGLSVLRKIADHRDRVAVNPAISIDELSRNAEAFTRGITSRFLMVDNYRVAANLYSELSKEKQTHHSEIVFQNIKYQADYLSSLFNYYFTRLSVDTPRLDIVSESNFNALSAAVVMAAKDRELFIKIWHQDKIVSWSKIVDSFRAKSNTQSMESIINKHVLKERKFHSRDIGYFGRPQLELSSLLRVFVNDQWRGGAYLVSPRVAITMSYVVSDSQGSGKSLAVEHLERPFEGSLSSRRISVEHSINLLKMDRFEIVALVLSSSVPNAVPLKLAHGRTPNQRIGSSVYILSYMASDGRVSKDILSMFGNEFNQPYYVGGTIIRFDGTKGREQYAYELLTVGGSGGSPVIDSESGEAIALHHSGLQYGDISKIGVGLDISILASNHKLREILEAHK